MAEGAAGPSPPPAEPAGRWGPWLVLLVVLGAFAGVTAWNEVHRPAAAPPFTLTSTGFEGGVHGDPVEFSLEDYRNRTLVLDLMAVSCLPCRAVTQEVLQPLWERRGGDPRFALVSIDTWADPALGGFGETRDDLVELQEETGAAWRHALDTDRVYESYSAVQLPKLVVVDGDGRIVYAKTGAQDLGDVERAVGDSLAGVAQPVPFLRAGTTALAAVAGLAAFFAPCSIGLLPAYLGLLAQEGAARGARARRTLGAGLRVAAAVVAVDALLALLLLAFGPLLRPRLAEVAVVSAVLLIVVGALTLAGFPWDRLLGRWRRGPAVGPWAFGAAYGAAAFGCTGPVAFPLLLGGFAQGAVPGVAVLLAYAGALAAATLLLALLVAWGQEGPLRTLVRHARAVNRVAALLLVAGGAWVLWEQAQAGVL